MTESQITVVTLVKERQGEVLKGPADLFEHLNWLCDQTNRAAAAPLPHWNRLGIIWDDDGTGRIVPVSYLLYDTGNPGDRIYINPVTGFGQLPSTVHLILHSAFTATITELIVQGGIAVYSEIADQIDGLPVLAPQR